VALQSIGNWAALARSAASRLGTSSPAIVTAILAQWQCEQKGTWPPTRNNPGNVARGWASALSYPYTVEQPNPQPSNPIVTYPSASIGAQAYADGLARFSRYSGVRAAVAAGNGPGFLTAISKAGYGTVLACMLASYPQLLASKAAGAQPSGNPTGTLTSASCSTMADYLGQAPSTTFTQALLDANVDRMAKDTNEKRGDLYAFYVDFLGHPLSDVPCPTQAFSQGSFGGQPRSPDLITGITDAVGTIATHVVELVVIAVILLLGLWVLARDEG
jgi:hypothetical protein